MDYTNSRMMIMKTFAVITDIHGNSPALQAVLEDISKREIDHIFCLGDMVGIGPDSNQVLEMLTEQKNISFVIGNHDLAVISAYRDEEPPMGHENERVHHKWLAERINPQYIDFMSKQPRQLCLMESDHKLYFVHYHLDEDQYFVPIDKEPTAEKLDHIYSATDYDLVSFGHHHIIHNFKSDARAYFNPGSLGCYHKPFARYGIIRVSNEGIREELMEIPYNNREFLRSYEQLKVPDREFILKVFHGGQV